MIDQNTKSRIAIIEKFRTIARERLQQLNESFLELEKNATNTKAAAQLMREIHTLKGEAKLMGFSDINLVAHKTEDVLLYIKKHDFRIDPTLVDFVLNGFDIIALLLNKQIGGGTIAIDLNAFISQADRLIAEEETDAAGPVAVDAAQEEGVHAPQPTRRLAEEQTLRVDVRRIDQLSNQVGDLLRSHLQVEHNFKSLSKVADQLYTQLQRLQVQLFRHRDLEHLGHEQLTSIIKFVGRGIDQLQQQHGDLDGLIALGNEGTFEDGDRFDRLEGMMRDLRLLPLSSLVNRYPRAIRDLAREQGKKINVSISGSELEVDKQILDKIGEPLLHIIRNAVDHGIATPEIRRRAGKPEVGTISINAFQSGSNIEICVMDDGEGLSVDRLRGIIIERKILSAEHAEKLSDQDLFNILFLPGFSTREKTTDVSGRGIGLDIVKEHIEGLGGSVQFESAAGQGSEILMRVPISMALMRGLVVEENGGLFALPSHAIEVVLELDQEQVVPAGSGLAMAYHDENIPLHRLATLLGLEPGGPTNGAGERVIVIKSKGQLMGLGVNHILGEKEFVQRTLDPFLEQVPLFIGVTTLEHTAPTLILNIPEVFRTAAGTTSLHIQEDNEQIQAPQSLIQVVEDSELTRDMVVGILREMGHQVCEAADGRDALLMMEEQKPAMVLTDLEMPVMDGFELIAHLRAIEDYQDLPIVVLSSLGSDEDKKRAAELGADAYLVKTNFQANDLIQTVNRFLRRKP